jgi:hypothetical protein
MVHKKTLVFIGMAMAITSVLTGCATVGHLQTPSGRPEVFIEGVTLKDATNACVSMLSANAWQIEQASDYMVQAVHTSDNAMVDFMWGSSYSYHQTFYRLIFTFSQEANGVRVYGTQHVVGNKGTGFENVMALTNQKAYEGTQSYLESIRSRALQAH